MLNRAFLESNSQQAGPAAWRERLRGWEQGFSAWRLILAALALLLALALPSGVDSCFNGLPFSSPRESLILLVLLPTLCFAAGRFLGLRWVCLAISFLLLLKLALFALAPATGWGVKIYKDAASLAKGRWEPSYNTIWQKNHSTIMKRPWRNHLDFPVGWLNRFTDSDRPGPGQKSRQQIKPYLSISGSVRLPEGAGLALVASGHLFASARARDAKGRLIPVPVVPDEGAAAGLSPAQLPRGDISINALLWLGPITGPPWVLYPVIILRHGQVQLPFKGDILWLDHRGLEVSAGRLMVLKGLARVSDGGLGLFFALWILFGLWRLRRLDFLNWKLVVVMGMSLVLPWLLRRFVEHHAGGVMALGQGMVGVSAALLLFSLPDGRAQRAWSRHIGLLVLLAFGPGLFAEFIPKWWGQIFRVELLGAGHDWLTYQQFAREIVLGGNWLQSNIEVMAYQPLYRYITAFMHIFCGPTMFATYLLDIWALVGGAALAANIARRLGAGLALALLAAALMIWHYTADSFLFLLGSGLQEYVAMLLMMAAGLCVLASRGRGLWAMLGAGLVGAAAELTRTDHLGVLVCLGLLVLDQKPLALLAGWRDFFAKLRRHWLRITLYVVPLALAFLTPAVRNYLVGGSFTLLSPRVIGYLQPSTIFDRVQSVLVVMNAGEGGSITQYILWAGLIAALAAALWRPKALWRYPLSLALVLASLPAPYFFARATAYFPRWSIHLLPLAAISLVIWLQGLGGRPWFRAWSGLGKRPGDKAPPLWLSLPLRCGACLLAAGYLRHLVMPHWGWGITLGFAVTLAIMGLHVRYALGRQNTMARD